MAKSSPFFGGGEVPGNALSTAHARLALFFLCGRPAARPPRWGLNPADARALSTNDHARQVEMMQEKEGPRTRTLLPECPNTAAARSLLSAIGQQHVHSQTQRKCRGVETDEQSISEVGVDLSSALPPCRRTKWGEAALTRPQPAASDICISTSLCHVFWQFNSSSNLSVSPLLMRWVHTSPNFAPPTRDLRDPPTRPPCRSFTSPNQTNSTEKAKQKMFSCFGAADVAGPAQQYKTEVGIRRSCDTFSGRSRPTLHPIVLPLQGAVCESALQAHVQQQRTGSKGSRTAEDVAAALKWKGDGKVVWCGTCQACTRTCPAWPVCSCPALSPIVEIVRPAENSAAVRGIRRW